LVHWRPLGVSSTKLKHKIKGEMYIRTTKKLTEYMTAIYGKDMRNLMKYATERDFTEPVMPDVKLRSEDRLYMRSDTKKRWRISIGRNKPMKPKL
jgi:hypothetical protein